MGLLHRWRDPGGGALRKASRLAIVMTAVTVVGLTVIDDASFTTFASFSVFALLGLANFGGPLRVRFGLGLAFTVTGALLIAIGTLASASIPLSVLVMAAVAFVSTAAGVFGGYAAASATGLILAAVLSLMIPGTIDDIPVRLAGWGGAGIVASIALAVLWPGHERPVVRLHLSEIVRGLALPLRDGQGLSVDEILERREQVIALRESADAALTHPSGSRSRDQALLFLLDEIFRVTVFLEGVVSQQANRAILEPHDREVLKVSGAMLEATADILVGTPCDPPTDQLEALRTQEIVDLRVALARGGRSTPMRADPRSPRGPVERRLVPTPSSVASTSCCPCG